MTHKVHVHLTSRQATFLEPYPYKRLLRQWSYTVPNWNWMRDKYSYWDKKSGTYKYRWDGRIKLLKYNKIPAGLFWATYKDVEREEHVRFKIHSRYHSGIHRTSHRHWVVSKKTENEDYRFQNKCVDKIIEKMYKGGGLILSATGSGKTRMAAMLASRLKCDLLFVVDQIVLLDQAQKAIAWHLGENVGYVGESKFHLRRVTVATIQTLAAHSHDKRFQDWYRSVDVIMLDEFHEMMGKRNFDVVYQAKPKLVLGFTATLNLKQKPIRMKAYSLCGPVIYKFPLIKGQEMGVLSRGICIQLRYDNSIRDIDWMKGNEIYDKRVVNNAERNHLISRLVQRGHSLGKYTITLVDRLKHLEEINERLHGIPRRVVAGSYKGIGIPKFERLESKYKFERGHIRTIVASKVFKKGVDIKRVDVIIDGAGRQSKNDAIQKFGRGVRKHKRKRGLIYIDISDYDRYDRDRDTKHKNKLAKAARRRKRALKEIGIPIFTLEASSSTTETAREVFRKGERWLKKETNRKHNSTGA